MGYVCSPVIEGSRASSDPGENRSDTEIDPTAARQQGLADSYVPLTRVVLGKDDPDFSSEKDLPGASAQHGALGPQPVTERTIQVTPGEITIVAAAGSTILDVSLLAKDVPLGLEGAGKDAPGLRRRCLGISHEQGQDQWEESRRASCHLEGGLHCETDTSLGREEPPRLASRLR
jgi:hypothetical protein